jgi:hypothetical protein
MRLTRIEAAEVAAPSTTETASAKATARAAAKSAATTGKPSASTKTTPTTEGATSAAEKATGLPARCTALCASRLDGVANPVHIHAGHWAHLARLPSDGNRLPAKIGVARDRGQGRSSTRRSWASLGFGVGSQRARQAQALGATSKQLPNRLSSCIIEARSILGRLGRLLLGS